MAAGAAEPEPAPGPVEPLLAVGQEAQGERGERGTGREAAGVGQFPAPDRGPGVVDDQRARLVRDDRGDLGDAGLGGGPQDGVRQGAEQFPAGPRRADPGPRLGDGHRRHGKFDVVSPARARRSSTADSGTVTSVSAGCASAMVRRPRMVGVDSPSSRGRSTQT